MKKTGFSFFIAMMTSLVICSCGEVSKDSKADTGRFSLSEIYKENASSGIRFNSGYAKDDVEVNREKISEKWNVDFLLVSETRNKLDSLK